MGLNIKIASIIAGVIFIFFVLRFSKKNMIRPSYTILWLMVSLFLISIPVFESFYRYVAHNIFGLVDATNVIYIGIIVFILIYLFYITIKINTLSDQVQIIISSLSILESKVDEVCKK